MNFTTAGLWQGRTLSSATFCLTLWSGMTDLLDEINMDRLTAGIVSYADDVIMSAEQNDANEVWQQTEEALSEIGLHIDQTESNCARTWEHEHLTFKEHVTILGTEATDKSATRVEEEDATQARGRL